MAFVDAQLPLVEGQPDGPRMLEPKVEARLLQELAPERHERVLEIGAGSGFMAALLGRECVVWAAFDDARLDDLAGPTERSIELLD